MKIAPASIKKALPLGLLFCLLALLLSSWYSKQLTHANQVYFGQSGDGLKNYYTPWYHIKYDSDYFRFEGMNHPYGSHVVYADCQPLISNTLKLLSGIFPGLADQTVGILNLLMLLHIFLTGWLLYLIFRKLKLDPWYSALAAAGLAALSPQFLRIGGHYALAYSFALPLILLLWMKWKERGGWKSSSWIALVLFLLAWIHPYYLMIGAVFLSFTWAADWILGSLGRITWKKALDFLIQIPLPMIAFRLSLALTDPFPDRPGSPGGFEEFVSTWQTIFLPFPLAPFQSVRTAIQAGGQFEFEGLAYLSVLGTLSLGLYSIRSLVGLIRPSFLKQGRGAGLTGQQNAAQSQTSEAPQSQTSEAPQSQTSEAPQSQTSEAPQSQTSKAAQSQTSKAPQSQTSEAPQSQTSEAPQSQTSEAPQSQTSEAPQSQTSKAAQSQTSKAPQSQTSEAPQSHPSASPHKALQNGANQPPRRRASQIRRQLQHAFRPAQEPLLAAPALAGIGLLLMALGIPFALDPDFWTEIFPPIKQFRSLGRFSWGFCLLWSVYSLYLIRRWTQNLERRQFKIAALALTGLALGVLLMEAWWYHAFVSRFVQQPPMEVMQDKNNDLPQNQWIRNLNPEDYAGILVVPYYHVGSENLFVHSEPSIVPSMVASIKTGLPLMNSLLSRSPLNPTWKLIGFCGRPYRYPELLADLKLEKPLLVLRTAPTGAFDAYWLVSNGKPIFQYDQLSVYSFDRAALEAHWQGAHNWWQDHPAPFPEPGKIRAAIFYDGFDAGAFPLDTAMAGLAPADTSQQAGMINTHGLHDIKSLKARQQGGRQTLTPATTQKSEGYIGGEGRTLDLKERNLLYESVPPVGKPGEVCVFSFWARLRKDRLAHTHFSLEQVRADGTVLEKHNTLLNTFVTLFDGEWALIEREFFIRNEADTLRFVLQDGRPGIPELEIDELLLRKAGTEVLHRRPGYQMRSNAWFPE